MSLSQGRTLGRVGSILVFIPFLSIIGYILILIAINDLSNYLQDRSIFKNTLIAVALEIIGLVAAGSILIGGALTSTLSGGVSGLGGALAALAVSWIFLVAAAFFLRRSYDTIALKLGISSFRTTGLLFLIGAALVIVLVGFLLIFIGDIFQAISFFSLPEQPGQIGPTSQYMPPPVGPVPVTSVSNQQVRYCPNCGAAVDATARFCRNCGKTLV